MDAEQGLDSGRLLDSEQVLGSGQVLDSGHVLGSGQVLDTELVKFAAGFGFAFDDYQLAACTQLEAGSGVLVAAPTGAGKTIVGEFAVWLALRQGRKAFYTTPIKALSNQKYADLVRRHGADRVGLLTGDVSVNSAAPVVVMTTEVLRNMIYARSTTLDNLGFVVMDEVHYLADRFRGAVWEEVIIGLAESIQIVALSATVSNAEEFGDWLSAVRGDLAVVVSERRPIPLFQHVLVGRRLYDLFAGAPNPPPVATANGLASPDPGPTATVNPALTKVSRDESRQVRDDARRPRGRRGQGKRRHSYGSGAYGGAASPGSGHRSGADPANRPRWSGVPSRSAIVATLDQAALLPAIIFIFSRAGCDAAVRQLLDSDLRLTSPAEEAALAAIAKRQAIGLAPADLRALDYGRFVDGLRRGIAAHHAGMLPAFKEAVEEAFVRGLVKVVFATETLALGINMPARSVVLEKLVKYNGESHADITPGEFTQLTGRAGRRGIDIEGHAVVLWQPGMDPRAVCGLASKRTYPLKSSFAPTYNMAVNLVGAVGRDRARSLLEQSLAQFQTDRSVVGTARVLARNAEEIDRCWRSAACDRGDFRAYARIRAEIGAAQAAASRERNQDRRAEALQVMLSLVPGDIVDVPAGKNSGWAVVIDPDTRTGDRANPRPLVLTEERHVRRLSQVDFPRPPYVAGRMRVPKHFNPKEPAARRNLSAAFRAKLSTLQLAAPPVRSDQAAARSIEQIAELREHLRRHECHQCPERETHARFAERALRLERESEQVRHRARTKTNSIANQFDRICTVLSALGYLSEAGDQVTPSGRKLAQIYAELDLVAAECIRSGAFDGLTPPQLAAVLASLVFESRRSDESWRKPTLPDLATEQAMVAVRRICREVGLLERDNRLSPGPAPDIGFSAAAYGWAAGQSLAQVLAGCRLPAGDFVRWVRQLIDFGGQVANAAGPGPLGDSARAMSASLRRGIVAAVPTQEP